MLNKDLWLKGVELLGEEELSRRFRAWINGLIKKELIRRENMTPGELFLQQCAEIIADLNQRTGHRFTLTDECKRWIRLVMGAGYGVEDFRKVHQVMVKKWGSDEKMRDYLRPSTLWQASKFDERLALWVGKDFIQTEGQRDRERATITAGKREKDEAARAAMIEKLMARKWWEFASFAEFYKWTSQFPDAESLGKYEMPPRLMRLRCLPGISIAVYMKKDLTPQERAYCEIKEEFIQTEGQRDRE